MGNFPTYKVVADVDLTTFTQSVNLLLKEGWQLQGGVSTAIKPRTTEDEKLQIGFSQALTKTA